VGLPTDARLPPRRMLAPRLPGCPTAGVSRAGGRPSRLGFSADASADRSAAANGWRSIVTADYYRPSNRGWARRSDGCCSSQGVVRILIRSCKGSAHTLFCACLPRQPAHVSWIEAPVFGFPLANENTSPSTPIRVLAVDRDNRHSILSARIGVRRRPLTASPVEQAALDPPAVIVADPLRGLSRQPARFPPAPLSSPGRA